jgi:hypothetical protein
VKTVRSFLCVVVPEHNDELTSTSTCENVTDPDMACSPDEDAVLQNDIVSTESYDEHEHATFAPGRLGAKRRRNQWEIRTEPTDQALGKQHAQPEQVVADLSTDSGQEIIEERESISTKSSIDGKSVR